MKFSAGQLRVVRSFFVTAIGQVEFIWSNRTFRSKVKFAFVLAEVDKIYAVPKSVDKADFHLFFRTYAAITFTIYQYVSEIYS